ncbi:MAG TPA: Spy/CpxP family protein refolding chaperone [Microvirga sp.]|jgi:hypothetical protein|nr:Spy/CpxP family protein refolding chaperone [Microvirga sp.]
MKALAILTAASVLTLAGAAAIAQQTAPASPPPVTSTAPAPLAAPLAAPLPNTRDGLSATDRAALADARIAAIQAGLKLTEEQRRLWSPVERALRVDMAERAERKEDRAERREERAERREDRRAGRAVTRREDRGDYMQRIEERAARASEEAERMRALSAAMKPFWASLDESQRRLLPRLMREARGERWRGDRRGDRPQ